MFDGVVVTYTKETLRAVQDVFPLHQALSPWHAQSYPHDRLRPSRRYARCQHLSHLVPSSTRGLRLAVTTSMVHARGLAEPVLGR
jgi:hypothetical protein